MKNLCAIIFCVIFVFLFSSINIINAETYEQQLKPYKNLKDYDAEVWRVLQTLPNGILISTQNGKAIIMIEGKFNVFDGQQFSKKHYLLKYVGTYKYIDTLDSNKSVPKLKLLKELKINYF